MWAPGATSFSFHGLDLIRGFIIGPALHLGIVRHGLSRRTFLNVRWGNRRRRRLRQDHIRAGRRCAKERPPNRAAILAAAVVGHDGLAGRLAAPAAKEAWPLLPGAAAIEPTAAARRRHQQCHRTHPTVPKTRHDSGSPAMWSRRTVARHSEGSVPRPPTLPVRTTIGNLKEFCAKSSSGQTAGQKESRPTGANRWACVLCAFGSVYPAQSGR
jgi:hypothetical protein